jgi:hypothetical protein
MDQKSSTRTARERAWQAKRQMRQALPRRIVAVERANAELRKKAKGLKIKPAGAQCAMWRLQRQILLLLHGPSAIAPTSLAIVFSMSSVCASVTSVCADTATG